MLDAVQHFGAAVRVVVLPSHGQPICEALLFTGPLCGQHEFVTALLEADYLVVGAGAAGMAFTDALIEHADVSVVMVDRRHGVGGHWLDAYPFVRLHQASAFYGVASTLLGDGRSSRTGPRPACTSGRRRRRSARTTAACCASGCSRPGRCRFYPSCEYLGDGRFVSRVSGKRLRGSRAARASSTPATSRPRSRRDAAAVRRRGRRARVAVNDLVKLEGAPSQYVIVGSGKTATDACIWLLDNGVDPDAICWVRPRDPWMLNRAVVQPDPAVFIGMAADTLRGGGRGSVAGRLVPRMEEAGVMLRIDRSVTPTMAKTPTLAPWELDLLRTIDHVVRLGHIRTWSPAGWCSPRARSPWRRTRWSCTAPHRACSTRPWCRSGAPRRSPCSRSGPGSRASARRSPATSRPPRRRRREEPAVPALAVSNTPADWARMQVLGSRARCPSRPTPTSRPGPTAHAQPGSHPAGPGRLRRAGCRRGALPRARRAGDGPAWRSSRACPEAAEGISRDVTDGRMEDSD